MAEKSLSRVAVIMKNVDFCQFATHTEGGLIAARPMSTNSQVE
ncbi:MAG: hypothetical protein P1U53_12620 [Sulfitobacter sp.]|nr:hypothetical protein [Sulfitobacter sp.]